MPSAPVAARIFIISEPAIYRAALRLLLDAEPGFHVVGAAADGVQAFQAARKTAADVVLLDLATPLPSDSGTLSALARACAPARIILLGPSLDRHQLLAALLDGVRGVLVKDVSSDVLFRSIRAVAAGQCWIEREAVADLVQGLAEIARTGRPPAQRKSFGLSARELDIVAALATGCVNKEIAKRFAISEKTVKHHLTHIFEKLGLSSRLEVALFAFDHGLLTNHPASPPDGQARSRKGRSSKSSRS
jgi:two-component system nitrate/nitrite response regulator NarL